MMTDKTAIFWFRRDLRLEDNHGLFEALQSGSPVIPVFVFDTQILDHLEDKKDARVEFIHLALQDIDTKLKNHGAGLHVAIGDPTEVIPRLANQFNAHTVYANRDYEPYARKRDESVYRSLLARGINFKGYKDQVLFEKSEVMKADGLPYTVFTPYSKKWKSLLAVQGIPEYPSETLLSNMKSSGIDSFPGLSDIGFEASGIEFPSEHVADGILQHYAETRDIPGIRGTSRLSVHLRFGTIPVRKLTARALNLNEKYLNELIWREFYQMILWHFPQTVDNAFNSKYDRIEWENDENLFALWKEGKTGYPIVDAGMRELNQTGYMHNRVRMVVASFLSKHLLIDWRWGERYFASKLLDFDLASNIGGWQWAAGCGCDAAPYFRVFNPYLQQQKFDPDYAYIRKWIPGFDPDHYLKPIVEHTFARDRAIRTYKVALEVREV